MIGMVYFNINIMTESAINYYKSKSIILIPAHSLKLR